MPDCTEAIQVDAEALSKLDGSDDPDQVREAAVTHLGRALSIFAQGPNEVPIKALVDRCHDRIKWANAQPVPVPDCTELIQGHTEALSHVNDCDHVNQMLESSVTTLCNALSVFAQGPNEQPVQLLLSTVEKLMERAKNLTPPMPDYAPLLQLHVDRLEALEHEANPKALDEAEIAVLCNVLMTFAQGPNEAPIQALLDAVERLNKQKDIDTPCSDGDDPLQPHIKALTALESLDDPDGLTAAAAITLYEALAEMASGPHEASIRALLDTFDQVTGAV